MTQTKHSLHTESIRILKYLQVCRNKQNFVFFPKIVLKNRKKF